MIGTLTRTACLSIALATLSSAAESAPAPRLSISRLDQLKTPLPLPYNPKANANAAVKAAKERAWAHGKLLLIDLGGNWCPDCRNLAGVFQLPEVARFLKAHYEIVIVDVGRMDRNLQIPAHYGIAKVKGVPALLVVDPRTDKLINADDIFALTDARSMTPQSLADWLARWV